MRFSILPCLLASALFTSSALAVSSGTESELPLITVEVSPKVNGQRSFTLPFYKQSEDYEAGRRVYSASYYASVSFGEGPEPKRITRATFSGGPEDATLLGCAFTTYATTPFGEPVNLVMLQGLGRPELVTDGVFFKGGVGRSDKAYGLFCFAYYR